MRIKTRYSFLCLLVLLLLIGSCAEKSLSNQTLGNAQQGAEEIKGVISTDLENKPISYKTDFKSYTVNDDGDLEFSCKQSQVSVIDGKVHTVWSATSQDGVRWEEEQFIRQGSVPEVILFHGKYYLFVMSSCLMYMSDDGLTFEPYTYILKNESLPDTFRNFGGVDPTALVDNGTIRLFFYEPDFQGMQPSDPASLTGEHKIIQYLSTDGVTWKRVGEAVAVEGITDPDVVFYDDLYYIFMSKGTTVIASSSEDAETFSVLNNGATVHALGGVPDTIVIDDTMYMYAHRSQKETTTIYILKSTDGLSWEEEGIALEDAESPSVVQLEDGSYRMYYVKRLSQEEYAQLVEKD